MECMNEMSIITCMIAILFSMTLPCCLKSGWMIILMPFNFLFSWFRTAITTIYEMEYFRWQLWYFPAAIVCINLRLPLSYYPDYSLLLEWIAVLRRVLELSFHSQGYVHHRRWIPIRAMRKWLIISNPPDRIEHTSFHYLYIRVHCTIFCQCFVEMYLLRRHLRKYLEIHSKGNFWQWIPQAYIWWLRNSSDANERSNLPSIIYAKIGITFNSCNEQQKINAEFC